MAVLSTAVSGYDRLVRPGIFRSTFSSRAGGFGRSSPPPVAALNSCSSWIDVGLFPLLRTDSADDPRPPPFKGGQFDGSCEWIHLIL